MTKKLIALALLTTINSYVFAERFITISASQMAEVKVHTTHHNVPSARNYTVIKIAGLQEGCTTGVYLKVNDNPVTMSMVISAQLAGTGVKVGYEPLFKSPWGDSTICALTNFILL